MPVNLQDNIRTNLRQLSRNFQKLGLTIRDSVQSNVIIDNLKDLQNKMANNVKDFGENIKNNFENSVNPAFKTKGATKRWSKQYDYGSMYKIRSVRRLLDIIERRYSYVSITLLLISTTFESIAVAFFLRAQYKTSLKDWRAFQWGMPNFVILSVLSIFFAFSWIALLSSENKKVAYLFKPTSIMTYLTSFWMLFLAAAAIVTQNKNWTTVYAPMFFRCWWLHECVLALLDYPQISCFFTDNKLEMLRSFIQCMAVIAISVGLLQVVEMLCGDHMEYFNTFYMMMIVFSTIGYGDVVVNTVPGRLVLIFLIGVGISYFVPMLEYIANLGVEHWRYAKYATWFKRVNHVIFCGNLGHNDLRMQLENLFAGNRSYFNTHVVVLLPDQPSAEILLLLNAPKYRSTVTLLVGDPGNEDDLVRCNARGASGVFLLGGGANSSYYDDYNVARQAMSVYQHTPHAPLYVLLHRSRFTRSIMPKHARVIEMERLNHNLLGIGCVLPGMIPFVANLVRVFDPMASVRLWKDSDFEDAGTGTLAVAKAFTRIGSKQRDMFSYEALLSGAAAQATGQGVAAEDVAIVRDEIACFDPMWCDLYEASLAQHIEVLTLPENQRDRSFRSLATLMYKRGVTTVGVVYHAVNPRTNAGGNHSSPNSAPGSPTAAHYKNLSFASVHSLHGAPMTAASPTTTPSAFPGEKTVELAPRGVLHNVEKVLVICDKRREAQAALNSLPPVETDKETQGFDANDTMQALREHVEKHHGSPGMPKRGRSTAQLTASASSQALASLIGTSRQASTVVPEKMATDVAIVAGPTASAASTAASQANNAANEKSSIAPSDNAGFAHMAGAEMRVPSQAAPPFTPAAYRLESLVHSTSELLASPVPTEVPPFLDTVAPPATSSDAEHAPDTAALSTQSLEMMNSSSSVSAPRSVSAELLKAQGQLLGALRKTRPISPTEASEKGLESGRASPRPPKTVTIVPPINSLARSKDGSDTTTPVPVTVALPTVDMIGERGSVSSHSSPTMRRSPSSVSVSSEASMAADGRGKTGRGRDQAGSSISRNATASDEQRGQAIRKLANAHHMKNHFVFVDLSAAHERPNWSAEATVESLLAKAADYFDTMRPVRQHSSMNQIVLLANEPSYEYLRMMWEDEMSGSLSIIQGCGLFLTDLEKCNLSAAAAVVIFSAGDRCDDHGDLLTVLVTKTIQQLARDGKGPTDSDIPVVVELDHSTYVPLVGEGSMNRDEQQAADWVMDPSFLSGSVVCRHLLDTALQETYFIPEVQQVLEQLLSGWGDALSVTSIVAQAPWTTYGDVIDYCLERRLLPLAIHRLHEELVYSFRFIITNPPAAFPVVTTDIIYCLKIH